MPDPWKAIDPLGEALHFLRMDGVFYCRSEFTAPWGLALPVFDGCMMFHVVTAGECWLEVESTEPFLMKPGTLGLVPHGQGHRLVSSPGFPAEPLFDLHRESVSERYEILRHGGCGASTSAICGLVRFDHPAADRLIHLLPALISVDMWQSSEADWLQTTLRFMAAEAREPRPGGETIITRLADILVVQAIRSWIASAPAAQTGWLGALRDKQIGRAIALIHRDPVRDWTLPSLASEVGMSRSAFAARFTRLVGEPAMQYVTRWRMHSAVTRLRDASVAEVADRFGYESEAAFSRAFKRHTGVAPGSVRRSAAR